MKRVWREEAYISADSWTSSAAEKKASFRHRSKLLATNIFKRKITKKKETSNMVPRSKETRYNTWKTTRVAACVYMVSSLSLSILLFSESKQKKKKNEERERNLQKETFKRTLSLLCKTSSPFSVWVFITYGTLHNILNTWTICYLTRVTIF